MWNIRISLLVGRQCVAATWEHSLVVSCKTEYTIQSYSHIHRYLPEFKVCAHKNLHMGAYPDLFITVKLGEQPTCSLAGKQINWKAMKSYLAIKRNEV